MAKAPATPMPARPFILAVSGSTTTVATVAAPSAIIRAPR